MSDEATLGVTWGRQKRLEFIDFRLFWEGRLNRKALHEVFDISMQQASDDIDKYKEFAPRNLTYDRSEKAYIRTPDFEPLFIAASPDRFLLQLMAIERGWMQQGETWFDTAPPVEIVSLRRPPTDARNLLRVLDAIRDRQEMTVEYLSMTGSPDTPRVIAPHAFAYSAGRWYVRAWSREHNDFRDYNLNRIKRVVSVRFCSIDPAQDFEWAHKINLIIAPNPALSEEKQEAVATEYAMKDRRLVIPVRLNLAFYLMSEHNLDVPAGTLRPEKQQLVLLNHDDVQQARRAARQLSIEALRRSMSDA